MSEKQNLFSEHDDAEQQLTSEQADELHSRRQFLIGLGKWSRAVITGAVLGSAALMTDKPAQAGWLNRRGAGWGGGWINGGGGSWLNRRGGWGGSWINRR